MKTLPKIFILVSFLILQSVSFGQSQIINEIIQQTNIDSLEKYVRILSGEDSVFILGEKRIIETREAATEGNKLAGDYIYQTLQSFGLNAERQVYSSDGENIVAEQVGSIYPDKKFVIGGHYDAVTYFCADDNASGTAAVLEAARIISGYQTDYTIVYVLWDEEEIGKYGSGYFVENAYNNNENILGAINIDMIGYDGDDNGVGELHAKEIGTSIQIANTASEINVNYQLELITQTYNPGTTWSDHEVFWDFGYGAILIIEELYGEDFNPFYHSEADRIDKFNMEYFNKMTKLCIGTIAELAINYNATIVEEENISTNNFQLKQNYPNPFNPSTKIKYTINKRNFVSLKVYDALGNEIRTLVNEMKKPGNYHVNFNGSSMPSGVYFYKLKSGNKTEIKKMTLLR